MTFIYLDGHATTPLAPEAASAMQAAWSQPTNAGSPHAAGARAAAIIHAGRNEVARLIGATPNEIIFTSGATEANNLAILGVARAGRSRSSRRRIVVSAIEHKSVLAPAEFLRLEGFEIAVAPVGRTGLIDLQNLASLVDEHTLLVSIGAANGELGVVQPISEVVALARRVGALVHSDLAQIGGRLPCDVAALGVDYASLSAHKMHGPAGIGALFIAAGASPPAALVHGGGQEREMRAGTVPTPLVAGFGAAAAAAGGAMVENIQRARAQAQAFLDALSAQQVTWKPNGCTSNRLPGSLSIQLVGVDAESIVERLSSTVAISTGSACHAGQFSPSHVLTAIGLLPAECRSTIRICFGRYSRDDDPEVAAERLAAAVRAETLAHWMPRPVASGHV